jgi:hypothetical protein
MSCTVGSLHYSNIKKPLHDGLQIQVIYTSDQQIAGNKFEFPIIEAKLTHVQRVQDRNQVLRVAWNQRFSELASVSGEKQMWVCEWNWGIVQEGVWDEIVQLVNQLGIG